MHNSEAKEDLVLQKKITETHDLLSHVKEVRWGSDEHGEYLEFQFPKHFDFSRFIAQDGRGKKCLRLGNLGDLKVFYAFEWVQVRFFDADNQQFGHESVTHLMDEYKRLHGGVASSPRWTGTAAVGRRNDSHASR